MKNTPNRNTPKDWEDTMTPEELKFIYSELNKIIQPGSDDPPYGGCIDNYRAARVWISSQKRRYNKDKERGCCGSFDTIVKRWDSEKQRFDLYLIGFNYGH